MEIINQSKEICPIGMDPLKRIELIGKVCTKKETTIKENSAEKFFSRRIQDGHCAIAEHGILYYAMVGSSSDDMDRINSLVKVASFADVTEIYDSRLILAINLRCIIDMYTVLLYGRESVGQEFYRNTASFVDLLKCNDIAKLIYDEVTYNRLRNIIDINLDYSKGIHVNKIDEQECAALAPSIVHVSIKFITDRGVSHEFVRHRIMSFMQESTRWCKYNKGIVFIRPYWMSDEDFNLIKDNNETDSNEGFSTIPVEVFDKLSPASVAFLKHCMETERNYATVLCSTHAAQAARAVLGQSVKTELWITGPVYKWLGCIIPCECVHEKKGLVPQRTAPEAHPDMQIAMKDVEDLIEHYEDAYGYF